MTALLLSSLFLMPSVFAWSDDEPEPEPPEEEGEPALTGISYADDYAQEMLEALSSCGQLEDTMTCAGEGLCDGAGGSVEDEFECTTCETDCDEAYAEASTASSGACSKCSSTSEISVTISGTHPLYGSGEASTNVSADVWTSRVARAKSPTPITGANGDDTDKSEVERIVTLTGRAEFNVTVLIDPPGPGSFNLTVARNKSLEGPTRCSFRTGTTCGDGGMDMGDTDMPDMGSESSESSESSETPSYPGGF